MISDDDLLLYHYREGLEPAERTRIGAALSAQPELAQRLQALVARLDAAATIPEVPVPDAVQQRWRAALEKAAARPDAVAVRVPRRTRLIWPLAAAATAVIALVLVIPDRAREVTVETAATAVVPDVAAYERGLKWHLASAERQLASLDSATPEERARLIETIVAQNRIYALAAERAGEPQLARVLRAFAPVLEGLTQEGGDPSASIAQLGFELRIMQGRLNAATGAAAAAPSTTL